MTLCCDLFHTESDVRGIDFLVMGIENASLGVIMGFVLLWCKFDRPFRRVFKCSEEVYDSKSINAPR